MTCEEFEELSGAYALDAVTPEERVEAEAHLAGCNRCTLLIQGLRSVVALLPLSVTPVEPPETLRGRIFAALQEEQRRAAAATSPPIQRSPPPRRPRQRWGIGLLAIAATLLLFFSVGMVAWNISLQRQDRKPS